MRRALALAERGWGQTAPNPMVGAVVVAGDDIVGEGFHARYGEPHAEVEAIRAAGERTRAATLYVTLEPCAHYGKTSPCTDAVIAAGIKRVVVAVRDQTPIARGGIEKLRAAGIAVDIGLERDAALELNAPFFNGPASRWPWVTLKLAVSADGGIADPTGRARWITGLASRAHVHHMRANADAIAVGIGTVLADDPALTVRDVVAPRVAPTRVVFDRQLRIPLESTLVRTSRETPTIVITDHGQEHTGAAAELHDNGVTVIAAEPLAGGISALYQRGVRSLFVEGGARLAGAFLDGLVDRLTIFRSPIALGEHALGAFAFAPPDFAAKLAGYPIVEELRFGDDVMTTYAIRPVPCLPD
jgi:diaminohydroxyphosphoribosylaminopyrimidine deaminase/5-amino-6-(5-phosphoribosylamino)uracil reductase